MKDGIAVEIDAADALSVDADVLALKYAQGFHGADRAVAERLEMDLPGIELPVGDHLFVPSGGRLAAESVLFLGVPPLYLLDYEAIRAFARGVLSALSTRAPEAERLCITLHGPNVGLDERESFKAQIAGLLDAVEAGEHPRSLKRIFMAEIDALRVVRLRPVLDQLLPGGRIESRDRFHLAGAAGEAVATLRSVGRDSRAKPLAFVAMPFAPEYDDHFHYGIQGAAHAAGFLCERADFTSFTGNVMDWVRGRIGAAQIVIADLSSANPNVYLEVGYAWGREIPTVLLVRDAKELQFNVQGQRCLTYSSIQDLEETLGRELKALRDR